jgi:hypothetical protein
LNPNEAMTDDGRSPSPHPLDRHQSNRFERPMIETAPISPHAVIIPASTASYNGNVVLIAD